MERLGVSIGNKKGLIWENEAKKGPGILHEIGKLKHSVICDHAIEDCI